MVSTQVPNQQNVYPFSLNQATQVVKCIMGGTALTELFYINGEVIFHPGTCLGNTRHINPFSYEGDHFILFRLNQSLLDQLLSNKYIPYESIEDSRKLCRLGIRKLTKIFTPLNFLRRRFKKKSEV